MTRGVTVATPLEAAAFRPHYARFLEADRVYLTGHSHQAWPDVAREGLLESYDDAARYVDDKWAHAHERAERVRRGIAARLGGEPDEYALGGSTHELVCRLLSALDFGRRPHLVTTSGEFHSLSRQLRRLREAGVSVSVIEQDPVHTLAERLGAALCDDTAALLCSTVLFQTASIVPHLPELCRKAEARGIVVLLDAYHAFNVVPLSLSEFPSSVYLTAGGYKYAQWGEGVCFLRVPRGCTLRPVYTGWFADFEHLDAPQSERVEYGSRGADRFAGSTYDPASHYRASAVIDLFRSRGWDVAGLRELSLHQTQQLLDGLADFEIVTPRAPEARAGFVALRRPDAAALVTALRQVGVYADARGDILRFGPAPYVTEEEIARAIEELRKLCRL
jgi:kynureninase